MVKPTRFLLAALLACAVVAQQAAAYSLTGTRWAGATTTMHLQLGPSAGTLMDGFASWGASAEDALAMWNGHLGALRVQVVRDSTAPRAQGNRVNNVHFANDIYGQAWGSGVLAVTLTYYAGSAQTETDVVFNNRLNWNSYRGSQRAGTAGAIYDFHRVALHEFGHALGLSHPDEAGQSVTALMNSRISSLDTLAADDIAGAEALYGAAQPSSPPTTTTPTFPAPPPPAPPPPTAPTISAPGIAMQPTSQTVAVGRPATFSVSAVGSAPLSYQWRKNGNAIAGATLWTFSISAAQPSDAAAYSVVVSNAAGSVTSAAATLAVTSAPIITAQPTDAVVRPGDPFLLTVAASGSAPLTYQWRKDGNVIVGATASAYGNGSAQLAHAGAYAVTVTNSAGAATSASARVSVGTAPLITQQPAPQTLAVGQRLALTVAANGAPAPAYQWFKDGIALDRATAASFVIEAVRAADAGVYHAVARNGAGSASSTRAAIAVHVAPAILLAPVAQSAAAGNPVTFTASASGTPAPAYQWFKDGVAVPGATSPAFTLAAAQASDGGSYTVRATNSAGSVMSSGATLTIRFSRIVNLSTRAFVPAGGTLTPGFYVRGATAKPLLIRAVGPTLSLFGVGTALGHASLEVIAQDNAGVVATNAGWGGSAGLDRTFARVGAFPLAADSKDAAVLATLPARGYTVRVSPGDPTMEGVTLAEIYDDDALTSAAQLVNVSTLGHVGAGERVLTAGFVISGNASKRVLIRAVGPGLAPFVVPDTLFDPQLSLRPLGAATVLAANDDWPDLPNVRAAFTAAGAFELPAGSKDAALVITLEPGAYTVVVSGIDGATGNALVEIYDLDP